MTSRMSGQYLLQGVLKKKFPLGIRYLARGKLCEKIPQDIGNYATSADILWAQVG